MIKHVHDVMNLLYYKHWTHNMYHIYLWYTKCSNLAEVRWPLYLAHDVCDVHGAFSLYMKTCWQSLYRVFPARGWGSPPTNKKFADLPPPHQIFIPFHQKSIQSNKKIKTSFLTVVIAPVPFFCFNFILLWNTDHANFDFWF